MAVGKSAPPFTLPSIQGPLISLANYTGKNRVVLWFSRGFTCNFCRNYMKGIIEDYQLLQAHDVEVIQVAPNLLETARLYFQEMPPFPFVCDPDKRLYAVYGLGDRGVLEASKNTVIAFSTAFRTGQGAETVRASWADVANRNFMRRLHHHALTAVDQGLFIIDKENIVQYQYAIGGLDPIPTGAELLQIVQQVCQE